MRREDPLADVFVPLCACLIGEGRKRRHRIGESAPGGFPWLQSLLKDVRDVRGGILFFGVDVCDGVRGVESTVAVEVVL